MPCVELHNIPEDVNADVLFSSFAKESPLSVRLTGSASPIQVDVGNEHDAVKAMAAISSISINGRSLKVTLLFCLWCIVISEPGTL